MKKAVVLGMVLVFSVFVLSSVSCEAANLKKAIIGKWFTDGGQIEFLKDGTVIWVSDAGDYKFIDDNRLRVDIKGTAAMVFEVSIDKEGGLNLKAPTGGSNRFVRETAYKEYKEYKAKSWPKMQPYNEGIQYSDIEKFNKALAIDPNFSDAYYGRGQVYYKKGQYDMAIADYNKAIVIGKGETLNFDLASIYGHRGRAYARKGLSDKAIEDGRKVVAIANNNPYPIYNLVGIYSLIGNEAVACTWLKKVIDDGRYKALSWLYQDPDLDNIRNSDCYKRIMSGR